jgi:Uma2 family endonuclease
MPHCSPPTALMRGCGGGNRAGSSTRSAHRGSTPPPNSPTFRSKIAILAAEDGDERAGNKPMNVAQFLRWEDGTDTRYELVGGYPVAMAPPARAHGILCARLAGMIDTGLRPRRPCTAQTEAGITRPDRDDSFYVADIAVTCRPYERGEQLVKDPILIVEILSPGTERHDRLTKVPVYRSIGSVEEILLIDSESIYAEVLRREGDRWITALVRGQDAILRLNSTNLSVAMAELYDGIEIDGAAE